MHANPGNRLVLAFAAIVAVGIYAPRGAQAQVSDHAQCGTSLPVCSTLRTNCCTRDFASSATQKPILIPLDRCHQVIAGGGAANAPPSGGSAPNSPTWCADDPAVFSNAQNFAYGLVYRLMQQKIPVYWIVNPSKGSSLEGLPNSHLTSTAPDPKTKDVDFWVVSANSTPPTPGNALTLLGTETSPIKRLTTTNPGTSSATLTVASTYSRQQFPVRGGGFIIAGDDRAAFEAFWKTQLGRTCGTSGLDCYNFKDVNLYEIQPTAKLVWQDYTQPLTASRYYQFTSQLPVAMRVDYAAPKISLVDGNLLRSFMAAANLDDFDTVVSCRTGTIGTARVGCVMSEADIQNNYLTTGGFNWLWLDVNNTSNCVATVTKLRTFMTAATGTFTAGNVVYFNSAISQFAEQCATAKGTLGLAGTGLAVSNSAINEQSNEPMVNRYPSNLFSQFGDLPLNFSSGAVTNWGRVSGTTGLYSTTYDTAPVTLRRLMTRENSAGTACKNRKDLNVTNYASTTTCDNTANTTSADVTDLYAYGRYLNNKNNGLVFYSPGNNLTPSGQQAQLRMVLSSIVAMPPFTVEQVFNSIEITRSSPIIATVNGVGALVQGTYVYNFLTTDGVQRQVPRQVPGVYVPDDIANFTFPALLGHVRATQTGSVGTTAENLNDGTTAEIVLDASLGEGAGAGNTFPTVNYAGCSPPYDGTCRGIFTTTTTGSLPTAQVVHQSNTTVSALMLPQPATGAQFSTTDRESFVRRILKGWDDGTGLVPAIGGVDRSTVAVIGAGASVGGARPTIAYVGSTDGMLHAVCASVAGGCTRLGQELWAYLPRVNLGQLRYNTARIDGSARVLDVNGDFFGTGRTLRTVLLFQAGYDPATAGATPAIYALDVTDPSKPRVIWEYATFDPASTTAGKTPTTRPAYGLGVGLTLAAGQVTISGTLKNVVMAQTNNGGTAGAANVVTAIDIVTGSKLWEFSNTFPTAGRTSTLSPPASGVPPGVVPIDKTLNGKNGFMTDVVVPDLFGNLWVLNPANGTSRYLNGSTPVPLFQFTTDHHPLTKPAIYVNGGEQFAVFTSGGYADYSTTKSYGSYTTTQFLIAVGLNTPATGSPVLPLNETSLTSFVPIKQALVNLGSGYSQARIVGEEIFVTTDTSDVNAATFGTGATDTGRTLSFYFGATLPAGRATRMITVQAQRTGASSIANDGRDLFSSSGGKRQKLGTLAIGLTGTRTTPPSDVTTMVRKLWLRTE